MPTLRLRGAILLESSVGVESDVLGKTVAVQAKVQDKTRILCHISTRMHTNAHIFKKLGLTTTIQECFAEHYTRIQTQF